MNFLLNNLPPSRLWTWVSRKSWIFCLLAIWMVDYEPVNAQTPTSKPGVGHSPDKREQLESMRIAFYTREMKLTPQEATLFWPVFNQYKEEEKALRKSAFQENHNEIQGKIETMTEENAAKHIQVILEFHEKENALRKKYIQEIAKILSHKKALMFLAAEKNFKKELLKQVQERKMPENK